MKHNLLRRDRQYEYLNDRITYLSKECDKLKKQIVSDHIYFAFIIEKLTESLGKISKNGFQFNKK